MSSVLETAKRVHFIGIGGIGMSGIAEVLLNLGYRVSGSDLQRTDVTERLRSLGASIAEGHAAGNLRNADVIVYSSAIGDANPEMTAARERGLTVLPRGEMLAELMKLRQGIAVAGAHGKTTTTSMIAVIMHAAGLDPTAVIGGRLSAFDSNSRLGGGKYLVAEADESDRSFLRLAPRLAVITNIDREHMESYRDADDLKAAFVQFANLVPAGSGVVILCADDEPLAALRPAIRRRVVTYGLKNAADVTAADVHLHGFGSTSMIYTQAPDGPAAELGQLQLNVPGEHNVLNALAAVAVALELDIDWPDIASALASFSGAERRFHLRGEVRGVTVVEDYGHHPTEIRAVIAASRTIPTGRIIVAFQPHRFSRTQFLLSEFGSAFTGADVVVLTDIYAAGEAPLAGATLESLAESIGRTFVGDLRVVPALADVASELARVAEAGDLILLLGAGSIGSIWHSVLSELDRGAIN